MTERDKFGLRIEYCDLDDEQQHHGEKVVVPKNEIDLVVKALSTYKSELKEGEAVVIRTIARLT